MSTFQRGAATCVRDVWNLISLDCACLSTGWDRCGVTRERVFKPFRDVHYHSGPFYPFHTDPYSPYSLDMSHFTAASHLPRRQTPPNVSTLPAGARQLTAFEQQIRDLSPVFSQLLSIKYEYRIHPDVVEKFDARREQQLHTSSASNASYRIEWEKVIWAISEAHGQCFQHDRVHRFLDLGCSPGGFSNWLLESNPAAEGVGVTLPNGQARFPIDTSGTYLSQSRYQLLFGDIIDITLSSIPGSTNPLTRLGAPDGILRQYDFIVAGAFPTLADNVSFWHRTKLALCQVLIAFVNIEAGGSLMLVIKTKPFRWLVELVALLRRSFAVVTATGGRGSHAIRSSSYLICRRFRATSEQRKTAIETIRSALRILDDLTSGATPSHQNTGDGHRNERSVPLLERCSDEQLIQREGTSFLELLEPQWQAQERAIRDDLKRCTHLSPIVALSTI